MNMFLLKKLSFVQPENGLPITTYGVKIYNPRMQELLIGASWEVDRWAMVVLVFFDDRAKSAEDMSLAK